MILDKLLWPGYRRAAGRGEQAAVLQDQGRVQQQVSAAGSTSALLYPLDISTHVSTDAVHPGNVRAAGTRLCQTPLPAS